MQTNIMNSNIEAVARQRNVFIVFAIIALLCCLLLSLKLISTQERTILVPGLQQEAWTSDRSVSASYIEEVTAMYLPLLLDLDSSSIDWKRKRIMNYVARSDESYIKSLSEYFARVKLQYEQFSLSTHFTLKKLDIDPGKLRAVVHGQLVSRFGDRGFESNTAIYALSYEWVAGKLLLKEFVKLTKEEASE